MFEQVFRSQPFCDPTKEKLLSHAAHFQLGNNDEYFTTMTVYHY